MNTLAFIVTERCTAKCRFCGPRCSPDVDSTYLEDTFMNMVVDEAHKIYNLDLIAFTGGEPLLRPENLKAVIVNAKSKGICTRIVTNGFWGSSERGAELMALKLKTWGVTEINISVDDYHQEFVPIENVVNCVNALRKNDIKIILAHKIGLNTKYDIAWYEDKIGEKLVLIDSRKDLANGMIGFCTSYTQPIGWTAETENPSEWLNLFGVHGDKGCDSVMSSITINSQKRLAACCGLASRHIPALLGENVEEIGLKQAIETANVSTLWNLLRLIGPAEIINFIKENNPSSRFLDGYVGRCHACEALFSDEDNIKFLAENLDKVREIAICKRTILESNRIIVQNMGKEANY